MGKTKFAEDTDHAMKKELNNMQRGYLGECHVLLELAKRGIHATNLNRFFEFDLLTKFGDRIEIKTATLSYKGYGGRADHMAWKFVNSFTTWTYDSAERGYSKKAYSKRERNCDFFVLVCFNDKLEVERFYIVPNEVIGNRSVIGVPYERKVIRKGSLDFEKYRDNWDLIKTSRLNRKTK